MKEHPGHFWICFWLFFICMHSCDMRKDTREMRDMMVKVGKSIAKTDNGSGVAQ